MASAPRSIHEAAAAFDSLPGIGPRAALRYAYWLAAQPKDMILRFSRTFATLAESVRRCVVCGMWSENETCTICSDPRRNPAILCIVATSQDVQVIEESGAFRGKYHVLGGRIDPIEGKTPETLQIPALIRRIETTEPKIQEVLLALDPDMAGDTTALYLTHALAPHAVTVSRLARGIQHGAQIEYADGTTIADAITNRRDIRSSINQNRP
jgi:recombination protein RecR